ncbi:MAG: hypothetical protein R3C20_01790 [Planctomycetaceae bacterium]
MRSPHFIVSAAAVLLTLQACGTQGLIAEEQSFLLASSSGNFQESARPADLKGDDAEPLGSTMTLESLQAQSVQKQQQKEPPTISVQPAAEPSPALRLKFYPPKWQRKPDQAVLHFSRAMLLANQIPAEARKLWQSEEWQTDNGNGKSPSDKELGDAVGGLASVFAELHAMAISEDFTFDHRLRDIRGAAVYEYLLPDVQEARTLARLLKLQIRHQRQQRDFDGAVASISDGIRLAEFVGQGEGLIQQLVGIAVAGMMRDEITLLIQTEGCPNLYWALASIPRPLISVSDSIQWELHNLAQVFPMLEESTQGIWSQQTADEKWRSLTEGIQKLSWGDSSDSLLAMAVIGATQTENARQRLLQSGFPASQLNQMPQLQILLLDTHHEVHRLGDEAGKAQLLPPAMAMQLGIQQQKQFQTWLREHQLTSVSGILAGLLFPSVIQGQEAGLRCTLGFDRLMTLEALRMHAATHDGQLPATLEELAPVPAMLDPYTNRPFEYSVTEKDGHRIVTLKAAGPATWKALQILKVQF